MILKNDEREKQYAEHVQGGKGRMQRDPLLTDGQLGGVCSYVAQISLEPGCSIGLHQHTGDCEMYFVTEGAGTYTDNGVESEVVAGDMMFCPDGSTHGIENTGTGMLRFVAVIQKTN